jgi:hypothetical protein
VIKHSEAIRNKVLNNGRFISTCDGGSNRTCGDHAKKVSGRSGPIISMLAKNNFSFKPHLTSRK